MVDISSVLSKLTTCSGEFSPESARQVICLMGPTAAGKTALAIELTKHLPCDIISVDSSMVYRGMDIGTAKPTVAELTQAPHRLIDICDPAESYSAGQFHTDAVHAIEAIFAAGRIPLLVGGTMLYFRVLQQGISNLPTANAVIRLRLTAIAQEFGVVELHKRLQAVDPIAAQRIEPTDAQRLQRALEIYELTGKSLTTLHTEMPPKPSAYAFINIALAPSDRTELHAKISARLDLMLEQGFIDEVRELMQRQDLYPDLPSMRAVGYRQVWRYLAGEIDYANMRELILIATRQLAKRQYTWLRSWADLHIVES